MLWKPTPWANQVSGEQCKSFGESRGGRERDVALRLVNEAVAQRVVWWMEEDGGRVLSAQDKCALLFQSDRNLLAHSWLAWDSRKAIEEKLAGRNLVKKLAEELELVAWWADGVSTGEPKLQRRAEESGALRTRCWRSGKVFYISFGLMTLNSYPFVGWDRCRIFSLKIWVPEASIKFLMLKTHSSSVIPLWLHFNCATLKTPTSRTPSGFIFF